MEFPHEKVTEMSHFLQLLYFNHLPRCQHSTTHCQEATADDAASDTFDGHHCESPNCPTISTVGTAANDSQQVVIGSSEFVAIATSTTTAFGRCNAYDKLGAMSEFHHHQWRPRRSNASDRWQLQTLQWVQIAAFESEIETKIIAFNSHSTGNPDILICGNCRELFADLNEFLEHRRAYCKLRFTCKCQDQHPIATNSSKKCMKFTTRTH